MRFPEQHRSLAAERLLAVIETQNEIAAAGLNLEAVMQLVVERAASLTGASGSVIEMVEGDELVYRAVAGSAEHSLGLRLRRATSLSGLCVRLAKTLRCEDVETDPRVDREACRRVGVSSMICVPLFHHGAPVGALKVLERVARAFEEDDGIVLELLAGVIAAAMSHAAAFEIKERESRLDSLTGLPNRRSYDEKLSAEVAFAQLRNRVLSLILIDLDGFKAVNDRWGHPFGDGVLREVGRILRQEMPPTSHSFRIGGDEFAILMPNTPAEVAVSSMEACAELVRRDEVGNGVIGLSAGVAELDLESAQDLHRRTDRRLYDAKAQNRVVRGAASKPEYRLTFPSIRPPPSAVEDA